MRQDHAIRRATFLYQQGRYAMAIEELQLALAADPGGAEPRILLSLCHTGAGAFEAGMSWARAAIEAEPDNAEGYYAWAWSVARDTGRQRKIAAAGAALREALRLDPHNADYYYLLAWTHTKLGQADAALTAIERGLRVDPHHAECLRSRAELLSDLGRSQAAEADALSALAIAPEEAHLHASRGWVLLGSRKPAEAEEQFIEAIRLDPGQQSAKDGLAEAVKARWPLHRLLVRGMREQRRTSIALVAVASAGTSQFVAMVLESLSPDPAKRARGHAMSLLTLPAALLLVLIVAAPGLYDWALRRHRIGRTLLGTPQIARSNLSTLLLPWALAAAAAFLHWRMTGDAATLRWTLWAGLLVLALAAAWTAARRG